MTLHAKRFNIVSGCPALAKDLVAAIREAAVSGDVLVVDPGHYTLDAPVHVEFTSHHTEPWGIWAFGATFKAAFTDALPLVLLEATGSAQCRCLSIDGLGLRGQSRLQKGLKLLCKATGAAIYRFNLNRLAVQGCDDAIDLEGNVFEGDISQPWCSDNNNGIALGNPIEGGIISAINVFGGSLSQNFKDGLRTYAGVQYHEPYDFQMFGTYIGNNGRYSINAKAGVQLLKGVRLENPWCDPAAHDPEGKVEHACVKLANFGTLEQCVGGGNGNGTALVDGYLSGSPLTLRECRIYSSVGRAVKLAKLDGAAGQAFCSAIASPQRLECSDKVRLTQTP